MKTSKAERIWLIRGKERPKWLSCDKIVQNTADAILTYLSPGSVRVLDFPREPGPLQLLGLIKSWKNLCDDEGVPSDVLIFDQMIDLELFSKVARMVFGDQNAPAFNFFVYGDYMSRSIDWNIAQRELQGLSLRFIASSRSQAALIGNSIQSSSGTDVVICPPVVPGSFSYDSKRREEVRRELGLGDEDTVFLYSGRVSTEKNVDALIDVFRGYRANSEAANQSVLLIAGACDDRDGGFLQDKVPLGYQHSKLKKRIGSEGDVRYLGHQSESRLSEILQAADVMVSLSLYHQEDFGLAIAEGLVSGLPVVATRWGGHTDFASYDCSIDLLSFHTSATEFVFDRKLVFSAFENAARSSREGREERSALAAASFSPTSVARRISILINERPREFGGFSHVQSQWMGFKRFACDTRVFMGDSFDSYMLYRGHLLEDFIAP